METMAAAGVCGAVGTASVLVDVLANEPSCGEMPAPACNPDMVGSGIARQPRTNGT